jgi:tol-pal system protein YbgF
MTCTEARAAFSDLYESAATGASLAALKQHLKVCPACRAEWSAFQGAMQAVTALGGAEPSPGFAARVRQRVEEPPWGQRVIRSLFVPLHVKVPIQAVALVLLAFAGLLLYQRSPELRREVEPQQALPPVAREAPTPPAPPITEEPPRKAEGPKPRGDAPNAEQVTPQAPRIAAVPPPAPPSLETEKNRATSSPGDETKGLGKIAVPSESPKAEEPSRELRAKSAESGVATKRLQQAAPAPAEPGGAALPAPAAPKSLAVPPSAARPSAAPPPAKEAQTSSLQGRPADVLYVTGLADLADGKYERSIDNFHAFLGQYPQDARVPDARLRLGQAYFGQGRYAEALQEYEAVVRQFPSSPLVPTALYLQAHARLARGDRSGCQLLRDVDDLYPQAPEAALARETLSTRCR